MLVGVNEDTAQTAAFPSLGILFKSASSNTASEHHRLMNDDGAGGGD